MADPVPTWIDGVSAAGADNLNQVSVAIRNLQAVTGSYVQNPLRATGPGTKQAALLTAPTARQTLRVVGLGDSMASAKMKWMYPVLNRAFGGGVPGVALGLEQGGTGWFLPGVTRNSTTGTITDGTADFDAWFSGSTEQYSNGASRTYGRFSQSAQWDTCKVYYAKGPSSPDGGTFKIRIDGVDEAGFTSVSASNASVSMGIATITRGTVAARALTVTNLTGVHRIIGVAFFRSDQGGCIYSELAHGAIALNDAIAQSSSRNNLSAFLADFAPDLVTIEAKELSTYWATTSLQLIQLIQAAVPTATIVGIGSSPWNGAGADADQMLQNAQLQASCATAGATYWDGFAPLVSYANVAALGWAGDGVHLSAEADSFLAGLLISDLGILDHPAVVAGGVTSTSTGTTGADLSVDFSNKVNGQLTTADTGQALSYQSNSATLSVTSGVMTDGATSGVAAGYCEVNLGAGATVNRLGGELSFATGTTTGTATMVVWQTSLVAGYPTIPAARCHFGFGRDGWFYGVWPSAGAGAQVVLATGGFEQLLATDGTKYRCELVFDNDTVYIMLPDGSTTSITDSRIASLSGPYACWENFYTDAATQSKPKWSRIWASAGSNSTLGAAPVARVTAAASALYRAKAVTLSSGGTISTSSSTYAELSTTLRQRILVPPSGKVNHRLSAWVANSTSIYLWMPALYDPTSGSQLRGPAIQMTNGAFDSWTFCEYLHVGLTPGTVVEARWLHGTFGTGSGTVQESGTGRNLTMTVTAVS